VIINLVFFTLKIKIPTPVARLLVRQAHAQKNAKQTYLLAKEFSLFGFLLAFCKKTNVLN